MSLLIHTKHINTSNINEVVQDVLSKSVSNATPRKLEKLVVRPNVAHPHNEDKDQQELNLKVDH